MTPRQFSSAAQSMYDDGKISLDQLFKMQMASGVVDHGKTVLTATPDAPMDFTKYFQDQLAGQVSRGDVNGKGYQDTLTILGILTGKA